MNWRDIEGIPYVGWKKVLQRAGSPASLIAKESWEAAGKFSTVILLIIGNDSSFWTRFRWNDASNNNPGNIRVPGYGSETNPAGYRKYPNVAAGIRAIAEKIDQPPYTGTVTLDDLLWMWIGGPNRVATAVEAIKDSYRRLESWTELLEEPKVSSSALVIPSKAEFLVDLIPAGNQNRPAFLLDQSEDWYGTFHETANETFGAGALMHRTFTHNGGGAEKVSFHFTVDDTYIIQLLPVYEGAWHAGDGCDEYPDGYGHDDIGCFASVGIELCVNPDSNWLQAKRNLAELFAMLAAGDPRINGMGRAKGKFSVNRIAPHQAWSGKYCPRRSLNEGSIPTTVNMARQIFGQMVSISVPEASPSPFPTWDGKDKIFNRATWFAISRKVHAAKRTLPYAWADSEHAPTTGEALADGDDVNVKWVVFSSTGNWYYVDAKGNRWRMSSFEERLIPSRARQILGLP